MGRNNLGRNEKMGRNEKTKALLLSYEQKNLGS